MSLSLTVLKAHQEAEYRRAFAAIRNQGVEAIVVAEGPGSFTHRQLIVQLVEDLRLPAVYPIRECVDLADSCRIPPTYRACFAKPLVRWLRY